MIPGVNCPETDPALLDMIQRAAALGRGTQEQFALDRMSVRTVDVDGRLHVAKCHISKATVNPYLGREIPGAEALGLDPGRVYRLYRDPVELAAAAPTFRNIPLTLRHIIVSAESPQQDMVVGTIGSDVDFVAPYLDASLCVWTAEAKALVESGVLAQLSCAYRYRVDMTPGVTPDGLAYDGVMRDIIGNHVALVEQGRAGPDVVVADSQPSELIPMKSKYAFITALLSVIPSLSLKPEQVVALDAAMDEDVEKAANDAELKEAMDALNDEEKKAACDAMATELKKACDALTDEEKDEAYKRAAKDKRARDEAPKSPEGGAPKPAQDAKLYTQAELDAAVLKARGEGSTEASANAKALHVALEAVKPVVGVVACDSAGDAYKLAFKQLNVDVTGIPEAGYPALFAAITKKEKPTPVATDAAPVAVGGFSHIKQA